MDLNSDLPAPKRKHHKRHVAGVTAIQGSLEKESSRTKLLRERTASAQGICGALLVQSCRNDRARLETESHRNKGAF